MEKFNLNTRLEMYAICSSIEYDIKNFIIDAKSSIMFNQAMLEKAKSRDKECGDDQNKILDQLDLSDYIDIIISCPYEYGINNEKVDMIKKIFSKLIPVRNRVMHTKPLEIGDRALLIEIMTILPDNVLWINWNELLSVKKSIENGDNYLLSKQYKFIKEYTPKVFHNLPMPEFDDTGYVGRKEDIKEITTRILNKTNQVISIVGNGGMGKTAIAVKVLYDLLENVNNFYEAIIWITLKTKTLSNGEFIEIKNSICSSEEIFEFGNRVININNNKKPMDFILEFMKEFNVLLVLDNLETINTGDIKEFLRNIPENSKILITSRHGIGEYEIRETLKEMNKVDSIRYYRELSKYFGLDLHNEEDDKIYAIINNNLYNNPLSIKWYITGIHNGLSDKQLLASKNELISFCVSNIYEKLSDTAKDILKIFLVTATSLSFGEIEYYIEKEVDEIKRAINELLTTYMIQYSKNNYVLNDMAKDYISMKYPPENDFMKQIYEKRKHLMIMLQEVRQYNVIAPFNPNTIASKLDTIDKQLTAFHLIKALKYGKEKNWDKVNDEINKAMEIEPDFYETYKIKAFLEAENGELYKAKNDYDIALSKCMDDKEKAYILYLYSLFNTTKMQCMDKAFELLCEAEKLYPNRTEIILEKVRVYSIMGNYDEAERCWHNVNDLEQNPSMRTKNIMALRYLDLIRRKAQSMSERDNKEKYIIIKNGVEILDNIEEIDDKTMNMLLRIISDLSYFYYDNEAMSLVDRILNKYSFSLSRVSADIKAKTMKKFIIHKDEIAPDIYSSIIGKLYNYKLDIDRIIDNNKGIVVKLRNGYGFISNKSHGLNNGLFFAMTNAYDDIIVGDIVEFQLYNNSKGIAAKKLQRIGNVFENNECDM